jgi:DNA-binding transcriptional LysR family regulator
MLLRQLEYLTALARERHFGRAAAACHVSQPALSVAIRKLETELGVQLVHRDRRYDDLTPQGKELLRWAQQALAGVDDLTAEASRLAGKLSGRLRLGVIPTALPIVATIAKPLLERHPAVDLEVRSLPSTEIAAQLDSYAIDAGITYLSNEPLGRLRATPVYDERYVFLTAEPGSGETISWGELDGVPLCLLTPDMQNRRIIDAALAEGQARAGARIETNSISALLSFARAGWSSVVSDAWLSLYGVPEGMRALSLTAPDIQQAIGLVTRESELLPPLVRALLEELGRTDVAADLGLPQVSR